MVKIYRKRGTKLTVKERKAKYKKLKKQVKQEGYIFEWQLEGLTKRQKKELTKGLFLTSRLR